MGFSTEQLELLSQQHWNASVEQLVGVGMSMRTIERYRRSGLLATVLPGVVRLAAAKDGDVGRNVAALLYIGGLSGLTTQSAGHIYGLRRMRSRLVHVMVKEPRKPRAAPWIQIHRSSWFEPDDVVDRPGGLKVIEPMRLLFEFAATFPKDRFRSVAEDMWHRQLIDPRSAADFLQKVRRQGRTGVHRFEEWLEETDGRTTAMMSALETDLLDAIERLGLPTPARQHPLQLPSGREIRIDLAFPEVALGVEPGGSWWHGGNERMRQDYGRDLECAAIGWQIIRFDEEQMKDASRCADQVRNAYRARSRTREYRPPAA